ncbi:MAG: hypothetical protein LBP60_04680, partial [Spirochaetaceae bacterium]|nr:hypothetical protein [Spirochaetaceae bacterium]
EKAQDWGSRGLEATKDFAVKAGAKVQELGERGVLMLEIKQLEGQTKKLLGRFGVELYNIFESGAPAVSVEDPEIKAMFTEIGSLKEALEKREQELAAKKA